MFRYFFYFKKFGFFLFLFFSYYPVYPFVYQDHLNQTHRFTKDISHEKILFLDPHVFATFLFLKKSLDNLYISNFKPKALNYPSIIRQYPTIKKLFKEPVNLSTLDPKNFDLVFLPYDKPLSFNSNNFFYINPLLEDKNKKPEFIGLLGNMLLKRDKTDLLSYLQNEIFSIIEKKVSDIYINDKVRILYMISLSTNGIESINTNSKNMYVIQLLQKLGAQVYIHPEKTSNLFSYVPIDDVLLFNPSFIYLSSNTNEKNILKSKLWYSLNLASIKAFVLKNIYSIPEFVHPWDQPGIENSLFYIWNSLLTYPKIFDSIFNCPMINKIMFYLYRINLSQEEIETLFVNKKCETDNNIKTSIF